MIQQLLAHFLQERFEFTFVHCRWMKSLLRQRWLVNAGSQRAASRAWICSSVF